MNRFWRGTVLGLFLGMLGVSAWADDPPKKDDPPAKKDGAAQTPAEKFAAAKKAQLAAQQQLNEAFQAQSKATQAAMKAAEELIKSEPATDAGFDALSMLATQGQIPKPEIIKLLAEHHAVNPNIGTIIMRLSRTPLNKDLHAFMTTVMEKNPSKDAQGNAAFTLASMLMKSNPAEAEKLYEKIMTDYKDVKYGRGTLAERAEGTLFELRHLQIGKVVPEIEGEDMDGKKFKLSDYRGKVVMLDFWGHW